MAINQNPDVWDLKFKKEGFTFAFGSLMQAYSQIRAGEMVGKEVKFDQTQFDKDAYRLYQLAKRMCAESVEETLVEKAKTAEVNEIEIMTD